MAEEAGLDLVEISPNAEPPVCKILDLGKLKYENQKKAAEARKRQIDARDRRRFVRLVQAKSNFGPPIADRWLERGPGGILTPAEIEEPADDNGDRPAPPRAPQERGRDHG